MIVWSAEKKYSIYENRSSFKSGFLDKPGRDDIGAGAIGPRHFEVYDICPIDLRCCRVTRASSVVTVGWPTLIRTRPGMPSMRRRDRPGRDENQAGGQWLISFQGSIYLDVNKAKSLDQGHNCCSSIRRSIV